MIRRRNDRAADGMSRIPAWMRRSIGVPVLIYAFVFIAGNWEHPLVAAESSRPNVWVIVADDLGYSDLGCFGGEISTPNLDFLANGGLTLTQFYTNGRCVPSRASLLTGQYAHRVGLGHMIRDLGLPGYRARVADNAVTLGEVLQAQGYRTYLAGKWHLGTPDPTQRGFDEFYGTLASAHTYWDPEHYLRRPEGKVARQYAPGEFYGTDALADHALDFISEASADSDSPWFLYLAFNAPHFPLQAPASGIAKYADTYIRGWDELRRERFQRQKTLGLVPLEAILPPRSSSATYANAEMHSTSLWSSLPPERQADLARRMAIYAAMVERLDTNVGRVLDWLLKREELENTLILFVSDNGACAEWGPYGFDIRSGPVGFLHEGTALEGMGSPGTYHSAGSGWASLSNTPGRYFKHYTHEGGIAVPAFIHWPAGLKRNGVRDSTPVHLIDVMPTIVEVTGASFPRRRGHKNVNPMEGLSLTPLFVGETLETRPIFFEHEGNRAVRFGDWKLVALHNHPWELYHLATDRGELTDRVADEPERAREMAASWERWARAEQVWPAPSQFPYPPLPPLPGHDPLDL